ncbi:uncharacterized protein LOC100278115 precursor [Zea mays]|uniref:Uncharacterized protein n=1 Tax=Zea mays TaxID=4577 RepID=A0A804R1L4_MAIZE|nr:uncharacterized protein LOC100278115 precursor [Zea mays]
MDRCGGGAMASYLVAVVLLVALFASSAKSGRPEPLDGGGNVNGNGTAPPVNGGGPGPGPGAVLKLQFCIQRNCVYEGRGNAPCFCCGALKPNQCYETRDRCSGNCV